MAVTRGKTSRSTSNSYLWHLLSKYKKEPFYPLLLHMASSHYNMDNGWIMFLLLHTVLIVYALWKYRVMLFKNIKNQQSQRWTQQEKRIITSFAQDILHMKFQWFHVPVYLLFGITGYMTQFYLYLNPFDNPFPALNILLVHHCCEYVILLVKRVILFYQSLSSSPPTNTATTAVINKDINHNKSSYLIYLCLTTLLPLISISQVIIPLVRNLFFSNIYYNNIIAIFAICVNLFEQTMTSHIHNIADKKRGIDWPYFEDAYNIE
ncbi:hypothetical protein BDA99DRAFT_582793 [Phascolomyces articulosus]|uniref:Uncharacterized protein n=1 Tax=Phascolomyces articulosus TaxID=60185 RepID=A0AAD5K8A1_9FUNG|nr:hypothetical protein BDA99DRAFT_582793 [Phascolomyces articulosus]